MLAWLRVAGSCSLLLSDLESNDEQLSESLLRDPRHDKIIIVNER